MDWDERFAGTLLGGAVGDAIGLPREGLSARRGRLIFGGLPLRHSLLFGRGMMSDDTEHACMTAQALIASGGEPAAFARSLTWRLRGWVLAVPAGVGWATLRSILKLWCGIPAGRSGVKSAGNGPAMRAPIVGVWLAAAGTADGEKLVRACTRLTHTDERAVEGAIVVSFAVRAGIANGGFADYRKILDAVLPLARGAELKASLEQFAPMLDRGCGVEEFAAEIGLRGGVSGYINHTVPVALYASLRFPGDFRRAVGEAVLLGGDTDTVGAIVGGILGAVNGITAVPQEWIDGIWDWPRSKAWMKALGTRAADTCRTGGRGKPLSFFWPGLVPRNLLFLSVVLFHGFRRLLPPY